MTVKEFKEFVSYLETFYLGFRETGKEVNG